MVKGLDAEKIKCKACGSEIMVGASRCPHCGAFRQKASWAEKWVLPNWLKLAIVGIVIIFTFALPAYVVYDSLEYFNNDSSPRASEEAMYEPFPHIPETRPVKKVRKSLPPKKTSLGNRARLFIEDVEKQEAQKADIPTPKKPLTTAELLATMTSPAKRCAMISELPFEADAILMRQMVLLLNDRNLCNVSRDENSPRVCDRAFVWICEILAKNGYKGHLVGSGTCRPGKNLNSRNQAICDLRSHWRRNKKRILSAVSGSGQGALGDNT